MGQQARLEKMTLVRGQTRPARKGQAFKALTNPSSIKSDNKDHKNPLKSNKPGPPKAFSGSEPPKAPSRSSQTLSSKDPSINCYSQQDLNKIIQTFLQAFSKDGSGDNLKAKTLDIYHKRFYIKYYNFCQQYENHFATCGAIGPNQIPFVAFFLQDRVNFRWQQHTRKLKKENLVPIT